jgi:hypothetical protein
MTKNLTDAIYGDRANIRGYANKPETTWQDWQASEGDNPRAVIPFTTKFEQDAVAKSKGKSKDTTKWEPSCYESHPALILPGTDKVIYGGSCNYPKVTDADVYIGFDEGMKFTQRQWPWKKGVEFRFKIRDMDTPTSPAEFVSMVKWTKKQVDAGLKVHCGCIGGHGRTGMFLAALCSEYGEKDAITYVRSKYCKGAVESAKQVEFLNKSFGVSKVKGTKTFKGSLPAGSLSSSKSSGDAGGVEGFSPMEGRGSIW